MKKIPSVWQRDHSHPEAIYKNELTPGCEWVLNGEGVATRKWDGTAALVKNGLVYARYDAKHGKPPPPNGIPCQEPDPITGHWPHWVPATRPQDRWIREAFERCGGGSILDRTYEAVGPKIGGNPEGLSEHTLVPHGADQFTDAPREFEALKAYLARFDIEGVVFHHPDGRMAKATKQGFGLPRRAK